MENRARTSGNVTPGMNGFMLGIVVGAAIAGAVTLLYAPSSGPRLRNRIKDEVTETQQMFQTWMNDLKERTDSISEVFRTEFRNSVPSSVRDSTKEI